MFKKFEPKEIEKQVFRKWEEKKAYKKTKEKLKGKKKYFFMDGPPYASGYIHMGTALNKILKDSYIRFYRLKGYDVWDQPGYDTHGTPIEVKVEKELGFETKKDILRFGMEKFLKRCKEFATEHIDTMNKEFYSLGVWMDWDNPYITLDNKYIEGAWYTFKKSYEKGFLYEGTYPVHVCTRCETALAYNEIEYTVKQDPSVYVKFKIKENEYLVIWTTTPWTLPSNTAIMVHPDFKYVKVKVNNEVYIIAKDLLKETMEKAKIEKYEIIEEFKGKKLKGIRYEHPFKDKVPALQKIKNGHYVILSKEFVTLESGTGLVHVAPGHGQEDYTVGKENNLDSICPLNLDGHYTEDAGEWIKGMYAKKANKIIIQEMKDTGSLLYEEQISHDYPKCWRCDTPLLLMSVPQWFFKVSDIQEKLIKENKNVKWHPGWAKGRMENWLSSLGDWPVSRQRFWGIPLPIWRCDNNHIEVIGSFEELKKKANLKDEIDFHRPEIDNVYLECKECKGKMKRIPDVLDVWFDSGVGTWASLGYPRDKKEFESMWPSDLQIEGPDQFRGWWNSQLITSLFTFNKKPFKEIILHGMVLDNKGIKMSKSKGNVVRPQEVLDKYGVDILRLYLLSNAPWDNFYFKWDELREIRNALNILWNVYQFTVTYTKDIEDMNYEDLNVEDKWLLTRLERLIRMDKELNEKRMHKFAQAAREFIINDLSRWYIKLVRDRLSVTYKGSDKKGAEYTLRKVMRALSIILTPLTPMMSEYLYEGLNGKEISVQMESWPEYNETFINEELEKKMAIVQEITEVMNNLRQENKLKLRWPVKEIAIVTKDRTGLEELSGIIKNITNSKKISFEEIKGKVASKEFFNGVVYINLEESEELREERFIREATRKIQIMRKEAKKKVDEVIPIEIYSDKKEFLEKWKSELEKETNSKIIISDKKTGNLFEELGYKIYIKL